MPTAKPHKFLFINSSAVDQWLLAVMWILFAVCVHYRELVWISVPAVRAKVLFKHNGSCMYQLFLWDFKGHCSAVFFSSKRGDWFRIKSDFPFVPTQTRIGYNPFQTVGFLFHNLYVCVCSVLHGESISFLRENFITDFSFLSREILIFLSGKNHQIHIRVF